MKLNTKAVQALKPPTDQRFQDVKDDTTRGLYLRVHASGKKVWRVRYKLGGRVRVMVLGDITEVGLAEARSRATDAVRDVDKGRDPAADAQRAKAEERATPTVEDFAEEYIERYAKPRKKSWKADKGMLDRWVIPEIGKLKINEVRPRDLAAIVEAVADAGHQRQPGKVKAVLSCMFRFGVGRGVLELNPAQQLEVPAYQPTTRALSPAEIRAWWRATAPSTPPIMPEASRLALRLLLLTGQRPAEVLGMEVSEVDWKAQGGPVWTIPGARRKKEAPHRLPLPTKARETVEAALERCAENGYLFPNSRGTGPERADGRPRKYLQQEVTREDGTAPLLHDARRTVASELGDTLGFPEGDIQRALGHYPQSVTAQYIKRTEGTAGRPLVAWERHLLELVGKAGPGEVVALAGHPEPR